MGFPLFPLKQREVEKKDEAGEWNKRKTPQVICKVVVVGWVSRL